MTLLLPKIELFTGKNFPTHSIIEQQEQSSLEILYRNSWIVIYCKIGSVQFYVT